MPIQAEVICYPVVPFGHICVKIIDTETNQELFYDWGGSGSLKRNARVLETRNGAYTFTLPPTTMQLQDFLREMAKTPYRPSYFNSYEYLPTTSCSSGESKYSTLEEKHSGTKKFNTVYIGLNGDEFEYQLLASSLSPKELAGKVNKNALCIYFFNRTESQLSAEMRKIWDVFLEGFKSNNLNPIYERLLINFLLAEIIKNFADHKLEFNDEGTFYSLYTNNCAHAVKKILVNAGYQPDEKLSSSLILLPESVARQAYALSTQYNSTTIIQAQSGLGYSTFNWTIAGIAIALALEFYMTGGVECFNTIISGMVGLIIDWTRESYKCSDSLVSFFSAIDTVSKESKAPDMRLAAV